MLRIISFTLIALFYSCNSQEKDKEISSRDAKVIKIDEVDILVDSAYKIGDSRRYGIYPDSLNNKINPKTGKSLLMSVLDYAESNTIPLKFVEGYYGLNIILDSRKHVSLHFERSEFNLFHITNENGAKSSDIIVTGHLILYDRFGVYYSNSIKIDSLTIKTDVSKNIKNKKSGGCHIYKGTHDLHINYLKVEDLASGDEPSYANNHAALAIDGLRKNPRNISMDEVYITSSDRHGAYITGSNHVFKKIKINKYAQGSSEGMSGMQDSDRGEEKVLSGLWINRCNDCVFESVEISTLNSPNGFPLKLDEGPSERPTIIENLILDIPLTDQQILDDISTNILVKKIRIKK